MFLLNFSYVLFLSWFQYIYICMHINSFDSELFIDSTAIPNLILNGPWCLFCSSSGWRCIAAMGTMSPLARETWKKLGSRNSLQHTCAITCARRWSSAPYLNMISFRQRPRYTFLVYQMPSWSSWQLKPWKQFAPNTVLLNLGTHFSNIPWKLTYRRSTDGKCLWMPNLNPTSLHHCFFGWWMLLHSGSGLPKRSDWTWAGSEALGTHQRHHQGKRGWAERAVFAVFSPRKMTQNDNMGRQLSNLCSALWSNIAIWFPCRIQTRQPVEHYCRLPCHAIPRQVDSYHSTVCHLIWKNVCTRTDLVGGTYGFVGANRRHSDLPVARRQCSWLFLKYHYAGGRVAWTVAKQSRHIWQCLLVEGTRRSMACLVRSAAALHFDPSSSCWARCWSNPSQEHSFLWPWRLPTGLEAGRCGGTKYAEENFLFDDGIAPPVCYFFLLIASSKLNLEPVSSNVQDALQRGALVPPSNSRRQHHLRGHGGLSRSARWSPDCAVWRRVA